MVFEGLRQLGGRARQALAIPSQRFKTMDPALLKAASGADRSSWIASLLSLSPFDRLRSARHDRYCTSWASAGLEEIEATPVPAQLLFASWLLPLNLMLSAISWVQPLPLFDAPPV